MLKCPESTPWGIADVIEELAPGIFSVSTSSHGGIYVDAEHFERMPAFMRETHFSRNGWFEEDCDWCLPFVVFSAELLESGNDSVKQIIRNGVPLEKLHAWHKDKAVLWHSQTPQSIADEIKRADSKVRQSL